MKSFKVSNFRLFGNDGVEVQIKPVTVLTGTNSSGKSSYVKAMVLFSDYINSIVNDYRKDGGYSPNSVPLDFSNPKLRLKGFSSVKNKTLPSESAMRFSFDLCPTVSCYGGYRVTYSFVLDDSTTLDQGKLDSIEIEIDDTKVLKLVTNEKKALVVDYLDNSKLLSDFIGFCRYAYLPFSIIDSSYYRFSGGVDPEFCDTSTNQFDPAKAAQTDIGKRLAAIQKREEAIYSFASIVDKLPHQSAFDYKALLTQDLFEAIEQCLANDLVFYFPVLERFKNLGKEDSIALLMNEARPSSSISAIRNECDFFAKDLQELVKDFQESEYDSFVDYYRELENYVLENVNPRTFNISRTGRSFNYIEDCILEKLNVSYDDNGFGVRRETDTKFSLAYGVLSSWQWYECEKADRVWFHDNAGGNAITQLWAKDDGIIHRSIDGEYSSFSSKHILWEAYRDFVRYILTDCLIPTDFMRLEYNTGSWATVQRLHSFEEKSDFVATIKSYIEGRALLQSKESDYKFLVGKEEHYVPDTFLNKWLGAEGLCIGQQIIIEQVEGLGFKILIKKEDEDVVPLADMGHGITQLVSILIQIEHALIINEINDLKRVKKEGGNNDTCVRPIIAIEEPEVSLHPKFQSLLADVFQDAAVNYGTGISFILETHSEYLVRKIQAIYSGFTPEQKEENPFVVYYFRENGDLYDMGFTESGRFEKSFDSGFFDEAAKSKYLVLKREDEEDAANKVSE